MPKVDLYGIYRKLLAEYGPQHWWPMSRSFEPEEWEVVAGAVLTQNTNWRNVEKALDRLKSAGVVSHRDMLSIGESTLKQLIHPAGFYNQKAERLKALAECIESFGSFTEFSRRVTRERLLAIKGIGPETADSILLYACGKPYFVVDSYTRRLFTRMGMLNGKESYEEVRDMFESALPKDVQLYREYHALIVADGKAKPKRAKLPF